MIRLVTVLLVLAGPALGDAPLTSPLPQARPIDVAEEPLPGGLNDFEPVARPDRTEASFTPLNLPTGPLVSPVPVARPKSLEQVATASRPAEPAPDPKPKTTKKSSRAMCGDPRLKGEVLKDFSESGGCGVSDAVRLRVASDVALSSSAIVDCKTASALADWIDEVAKPAFKKTNGGLAELQVFASYSCRPRNNQSGARLSEHGKGHAIDIGGFIMKKGQVVTVLGDWGKGKSGKILAQLRKGACGIFGTVLGPGSDGFHRDHFHFDTARYRKGSYCR